MNLSCPWIGRPARVCVVLTLILSALGCRAPFVDDLADERSDVAAASPSALEPDELQSVNDSEDGAHDTGSEQAGSSVRTSPSNLEDAPPEAGAPVPAPSPSPQARAWRTIGATDDRRGDHGIEGPHYADIVSVTLEDDGVSVRVSVDVASDIPSRLRQGEVMGVGVDLWRNPSEPESDYQLFADGGEGGWLAYLQTPRGFVDYPGSFRLGGTRIVFEVPWRSLGDLRSGGLQAFADWSQSRPVVNATSHDRAPDDHPAPFER